MAAYTVINFNPCCEELDTLQFIADNPSNYSGGQTVIYNGLCYTVVLALGFGTPSFPNEPTFGGAAGGGPYDPDTAYIVADNNDCDNVLCPTNECGCYTLTSCNTTCDCIDIRIDNLSGFGTAQLTIATGSFPNMQPFWQFELVDGGGPTGAFFELSQDAGVGVWKIREIASITGIPNGGTILFTSKNTDDCPNNISMFPGDPLGYVLNTGGSFNAVTAQNTSCGTANQVVTTTTNLFEYNGQYIRIDGSDECFFVEINEGDCIDPISVTVTDGPYEDCPSCQNTCYLATNCFDSELTFILNVTNPSQIGATNSLSIEPGDIIIPGRVPTSIGDFDNCWTLELTECPDRDVVEYAVTNTFQSCEDCRILEVPPCYTLTDCLTLEETTYSGTLLGNYVGKTLQVVIDDEVFCYTVSEADECPEVTPPVFSLIIADCLDTCEECLPKCICSSAVNGSEIAVALRYIGCDGLEAFTEVVQPGARSERTCMIGFADANATNIYELGTCTGGECPSIPQPARKVKPGYDTPVCSADKYEKIVCSYSELLYKEVLQSRYGISDCCDEEDLYKREIDFNLLMLDVLNDPDYECTETSSNCGGCGYISSTIYYTECPEPEA